jgi:hypothetical protein
MGNYERSTALHFLLKEISCPPATLNHRGSRPPRGRPRHRHPVRRSRPINLSRTGNTRRAEGNGLGRSAGRARHIQRTLQGVHFDFRGKSIFTRYDRCEFVKCTLLID